MAKPKPPKIDAVDRRILALLQDDARMPNVDIARRLGMAPSAVLERLRKLRSRGVIEGLNARVNPRLVDFGLLAFVFIKTNDQEGKWSVGEQLARIPQVLEVHDVAGEDCYVVKLRTRDTESLYQLLRDSFATIPSIAATRTAIALRTVKETTSLPLETGPGGASRTRPRRRRTTASR